MDYNAVKMSVMSGMVSTLDIVPNKTRLAAVSCPSPSISAKLSTTDAIGVHDKMNIVYLKCTSTGNHHTISKAMSGKISCLKAITRYWNGVQKIDLMLIVASRIPMMSIQSGVVILPSKVITLSIWLGK